MWWRDPAVVVAKSGDGGLVLVARSDGGGLVLVARSDGGGLVLMAKSGGGGGRERGIEKKKDEKKLKTYVYGIKVYI